MIYLFLFSKGTFQVIEVSFSPPAQLLSYLLLSCRISAQRRPQRFLVRRLELKVLPCEAEIRSAVFLWLLVSVQ